MIKKCQCFLFWLAFFASFLIIGSNKAYSDQIRNAEKPELKKHKAVAQPGFGVPAFQAFDEADLILSVVEPWEQNIRIEAKKRLSYSEFLEGQHSDVLTIVISSPNMDISQEKILGKKDQIDFPFELDTDSIADCLLYLKKKGENKFEVLRVGKDFYDIAEKYSFEKITDPQKRAGRILSALKLLEMSRDGRSFAAPDVKVLLEKYVDALFQYKNELDMNDFSLFEWCYYPKESGKNKFVFCFSNAHPWGRTELLKEKEKIVYRYYSVAPDEEDATMGLAGVEKWKNVLEKEIIFPLEKKK